MDKPELVADGYQFLQEAITWANSNIQGIDRILEAEKLPMYYAVSLFHDRIISWPNREKFYDELYQDKSWEGFLPPYFVENKVLFAILHEKEFLTDFPEYQHWKGKTVEEVFGYPGDTRLMDTIGGEATRNTVIVPSSSLASRMEGECNVFYHELAHFLHFTTLTNEEFLGLESLYDMAMKEGKALDSYAALNSAEYFAQGLEAYLSRIKDDNLPKMESHTREKLKRLDQDLFVFIEKLLEPAILSQLDPT